MMMMMTMMTMMSKIRIPNKIYDIVYADPPWTYKDKMKPSMSVVKQCKTQTIEWLCGLPVKKLAADDCCLFLWTTSPMLPLGIQVMEAWGFRYKTVAFCWSKLTKNGYDAYNPGQWTMGNVELCLLGTKGKPNKWRENKGAKQLVRVPRTAHSRKPNEVRTRIVDMLGDRSRIELFARERYCGWDAWGDELPDEVSDCSCDRGSQCSDCTSQELIVS